jgi:hypothetical protein
MRRSMASSIAQPPPLPAVAACTGDGATACVPDAVGSATLAAAEGEAEQLLRRRRIRQGRT